MSRSDSSLCRPFTESVHCVVLSLRVFMSYFRSLCRSFTESVQCSFTESVQCVVLSLRVFNVSFFH